jgi:ribulose-phosphate 3-epimerase
MAEIIPSINASTFDEVQSLISKVEPHVSWCHIDVTDGVFSPHPTWNTPQDLARLDTSLNIEVHLMIKNPDRVLTSWLRDPIERIIVHVEEVESVRGLMRQCHEDGRGFGLALLPDTPVDRVLPWLDELDIVQALAVSPGPAGQKMAKSTYEKIRTMRNACSWCIIEVDGGINIRTAKKAIAAGANTLVASSYIFGSDDISRAIKQLRQ